MSISFPLLFIRGKEIELTSWFVGMTPQKQTRTLDAFYTGFDLPSLVDRKILTDIVGTTLPFLYQPPLPTPGEQNHSESYILGKGTARFDEFSRVGDTEFYNLWLVVDCPVFEEEYERGGYSTKDLIIPTIVTDTSYVGVGIIRILEGFLKSQVTVWKKGV